MVASIDRPKNLTLSIPNSLGQIRTTSIVERVREIFEFIDVGPTIDPAYESNGFGQ